MNRRHFLRTLASAPVLAAGSSTLGLASLPAFASAAHADYRKVLVPVELQGRNDGSRSSCTPTRPPRAAPEDRHRARPRCSSDRVACILARAARAAVAVP